MRRITTLPLLTPDGLFDGLRGFCTARSDAAPKHNWSQWRGPEGNGICLKPTSAVERHQKHQMENADPRPGAFVASRLGQQDLLTTDIEGEIVPGAKAVEHIDSGKPFKHPDSVGADRKHTFKVLCIDRNTGKTLWERTAYEGTVYDDRHRKSSFAAPTPATDGNYVFAYFGTEGLYCYDFSGKPI
jgi:outer membrane protein assembly factor BamB